MKLTYRAELSDCSPQGKNVVEGEVTADTYLQAAELVIRQHTDMYDSVLREPGDEYPTIHTNDGVYTNQKSVLAVAFVNGWTKSEFYAEITLTVVV